VTVATSRDQISINSQSILWVAGVGVGLLTLAFVLGVQVGKQSAFGIRCKRAWKRS
jgi:hypothetical protein